MLVVLVAGVEPRGDEPRCVGVVMVMAVNGLTGDAAVGSVGDGELA